MSERERERKLILLHSFDIFEAQEKNNNNFKSQLKISKKSQHIQKRDDLSSFSFSIFLFIFFYLFNEKRMSVVELRASY